MSISGDVGMNRRSVKTSKEPDHIAGAAGHHRPKWRVRPYRTADVLLSLLSVRPVLAYMSATLSKRSDVKVRFVVNLSSLVLVLLLAACAGSLPPRTDDAASVARVAPAGSPLADVAANAGLRDDATGAWPLPESGFALDARM